MGKQRDSALMIRRTRVFVDEFMKRRNSHHRVQQQNKPDQQRGDDRLSAQFEMTPLELQNVCNLAVVLTNASG